MSLFYDRHSTPITMAEWVQLYENREHTQVARTAIPAPHDPDHIVHVSTVWLGVNHGPDDRPEIFETLVDGPHGDAVVERYSTEHEAQAGHHRHVANLAADMPDAAVTDLHEEA